MLCRLLTGVQITDVASANAAMRRLLDTGVRTVVISSTDLGSDQTLLALASTVTGINSRFPHSVFTPPTQTRQDCLVLSCPRRRCEHNCNCSVSNISRTIEDLEIGNWVDKKKLIKTGSRQDKTVLSCLQLCSHSRHRQDKTVLSCP